MAKELIVRFIGDTTGLERSFRKVQTESESVSSKFSKMGAAAGLAAGAGLALLSEGLKSSVAAAEKDQVAQARLEQAFKNAHVAIEPYREGLDKAESAGVKLGFTVDTTKNAIGSLVIASGSAKEAMKELAIAQDLARFKGVSLETATRALVMAHAGSTRALKQLGITIPTVTTAQDALKASSKAVAQAHRDVAAAAKAVTQAQSEVSASAAALTTAQDQLATAHQHAADAAQKVKDAVQGVKDAETALKAADDTAKQAQLALTQARKDAAAALIDLKYAATDAAFSEQDAQLALIDATDNYNKVMADSASTDLDKRRALLQLEEAQQRVKEAHRAATAAAQASNDADKAGVAGSPQVLAAKAAIRKAHQQEADASRKVQAAKAAEAKTERELSDAHRAESAAALVVAAAVDRNAKASESLSAALAKQAGAAQESKAAAVAMTEAHAKAKDKQEQFQKTLELVTEKVHGQAAAFADTAAGAKAQFGAAMDQLQVQIGQFLLPALTKLELWLAVKLPLAMQKLSTFWKQHGDQIIAVMDTIKTTFQVAFELLSAILTTFSDLLHGRWSKLWGDVRRIFVAEMMAIKQYFQLQIDAVEFVLDGLVSKLTAGFKGLGKILATIIKAPLDAVIAAWNAFKIPSVHIGFDTHIPGVGKVGFDTPEIDFPDIPLLDRGGVVEKTGVAVVHRGEEFLGVGQYRQGGGGTTITVNVAGSVVTQQQLEDAIYRGLLRRKQRSGTLGLA